MAKRSGASLAQVLTEMRDGHRRYHEAVIEWRELRNNIAWRAQPRPMYPNHHHHLLEGALTMGISMMVAANVGASMYSSHQQKSAANDALNQQKESAATAEANRPQASKAPTAKTMQAGQAGAGQAGGAPGVANTFLTGAGGVDPSLLNLGRATLLGG